MSKESKALAPKEERGLVEARPVSMEAIILQAVEKGVPVETFERILAMKERIDAAEAKKQFDLAMADFQAELPEIKKLKEVKNDQGKLLYKYAPLESIIGQVKGILSRHGLSYSVKTEVSTDKVKSIVIVKHTAGHSEQSEMETPLTTKTGIMSQPQQIAATATFSKRYAFMNALGIMTGDEDNEAALEVSSDQIEEVKKAFGNCMTAKKFNDTWIRLPKELKANKEVIAYAKEIKDLILDAKKNEAASN
ncbi:MAG: ERF family protein [Patescibacteria group bacterium]|nr:ERF family protein [Patescibacteria group bacterium]